MGAVDSSISRPEVLPSLDKDHPAHVSLSPTPPRVGQLDLDPLECCVCCKFGFLVVHEQMEVSVPNEMPAKVD